MRMCKGAVKPSLEEMKNDFKPRMWLITAIAKHFSTSIFTYMLFTLVKDFIQLIDTDMSSVQPIWIRPSPSYFRYNARGNDFPHSFTQKSIYIWNISPICVMSIIIILHQLKPTFFLSKEGQPSLRVPLEPAINFTNASINFLTLQNTVPGTEYKIFKLSIFSVRGDTAYSFFCFSHWSTITTITFCRI